MTLTRMTALILTLMPGMALADAVLFFESPQDLPLPGESFEVSLYVTDGGENVVSYALEVHYDPKVLQVAQFSGGKDAVFSQAPLSDESTYASGVTPSTALRAAPLATPDTYQVARIRFVVVGQSRASSTISIRPGESGGLVEGKHYTLLPAQMPEAVQMRVASPGR